MVVVTFFGLPQPQRAELSPEAEAFYAEIQVDGDPRTAVCDEIFEILASQLAVEADLEARGGDNLTRHRD